MVWDGTHRASTIAPVNLQLLISGFGWQEPCPQTELWPGGSIPARGTASQPEGQHPIPRGSRRGPGGAGLALLCLDQVWQHGNGTQMSLARLVTEEHVRVSFQRKEDAFPENTFLR